MQYILNDSSNEIAVIAKKNFREGIAQGDFDGGSVLRYLGRATVKARCYERSAYGYLLQLEDPGNTRNGTCFGNMTTCLKKCILGLTDYCKKNSTILSGGTLTFASLFKVKKLKVVSVIFNNGVTKFGK